MARKNWVYVKLGWRRRQRRTQWIIWEKPPGKTSLTQIFKNSGCTCNLVLWNMLERRKVTCLRAPSLPLSCKKWSEETIISLAYACSKIWIWYCHIPASLLCHVNCKLHAFNHDWWMQKIPHWVFIIPKFRMACFQAAFYLFAVYVGLNYLKYGPERFSPVVSPIWYTVAWCPFCV